MNRTTIFLLASLTLQSILILNYEKKFRDPLLIVFQSSFLLYFFVRVMTLLVDSSSFVLNYKVISAEDFNFVLIFIFISNIFLFLGITTVKQKKKQLNIHIASNNSRNVKRLAILFILGLVLNFPNKVGINLGLDNYTITQYLVTYFLDYRTLIILLIVYIFYQINNKIKFSKILLVLICYYIVVHGLAGGRGTGFENVLIITFMAALSFFSKIELNKKKAMILISLLPLIFLSVSIGFFNRAKSQFELDNKITLNQVNTNQIGHISKFFNQDQVRLITKFLSNRMGYIDHTVRLMKFDDRYLEYVHPLYYFKSITDNVFTPGSDVFDAPLSNFTLKFLDRGIEKPSIEQSAREYHSTLMTIYGETYLWFRSLGFFGILGSLISIFLTSLIFKLLYQASSGTSIFVDKFSKTIILYLFYLRLNTFGLDWDFIDFTGIILTAYLTKFLIFKKSNETLKII